MHFHKLVCVGWLAVAACTKAEAADDEARARWVGYEVALKDLRDDVLDQDRAITQQLGNIVELAKPLVDKTADLDRDRKKREACLALAPQVRELAARVGGFASAAQAISRSELQADANELRTAASTVLACADRDDHQKVHTAIDTTVDHLTAEIAKAQRASTR